MLPTRDPSLRFENKHLLHGAISRDEQVARYGSYYAVFWTVENRSQPAVVEFEYRQQNTRDNVRRMTVEVPDPHRGNVTHFAVIGDAVKSGGTVNAWRAVVKQGGREVATYESFLWD